MKTLRRRAAALAGLASVAAAAAASCGPDVDTEGGDPPGRAPSSVEARVADVRARFVIAATDRPALEASEEVVFEDEGDAVRATVIPGRRLARPATAVTLPARADGFARVTDPLSGVALGFSLRDAAEVEIEIADGIALYRGALDGADVIHRVTLEGTEDLVVFEVKPARAEVVYDVDVTGVAGLRMVGGLVEFLDAGGAPRLRVNPPFLVGEDGRRHEAALELRGCDADGDPRAPWGREVTPPGAAACDLAVTWGGDVSYPAVLDPQWVVTGSLPGARALHTSTLLPSGRVLVAGGENNNDPEFGDLGSASLYDPGTGSFASTENLSSSRRDHTATRLADGRVVVIGGDSSNVEIYDESTGLFSSGGALGATKRRHASVLLSNGLVLVVGNGTAARLYDPATSTASSGGTTVFNHTGYTAAALLPSGDVLVAGGAGSNCEIYDVQSSSFTATGPWSGGSGDPSTATVLPDGRVLVVNSGGGSAARFNEATGTFTAVGALSAGHQNHAAAALATGHVLVIGGIVPIYEPTKIVERFDPATSSFSTVDDLVSGRHRHTATTLADGRVLVAGGMQNNGAPDYLPSYLASAEIYNAALLGATCTVDTDCGSGICANQAGARVCCAEPCEGTCETCQPGTGACVDVVSADDPDTCAGTQTCDAVSDCRLDLGQSCGGGTVCASGACADSVCCTSACGGACDACNLAGAGGTCTPRAAGSAGSPSCSPLACNGGAACPLSCAADADCATAFYCGTGGACLPRKAQGDACDTVNPGDCLQGGCRVCAAGLGGCVDGVCCNVACDDPCDVCSETAGAATDGTCATAPIGTQTPDCDGAQACNGAGTGCGATCSNDDDCVATSYCHNSGSCLARRADGQPCDTAAGGDCEETGCRECQSDECVDVGDGNRCCESACGPCGNCDNDDGDCLPLAGNTPSAACGAYDCNGTSVQCPTTCAGDALCAEGFYCDGSVCVEVLADGEPCSEGNTCDSGFCVDDVCCEAACDAACEACSAATKHSGIASGTCGAARQGTNPGGLCAEDPDAPCGEIASCVGSTGECALAPAGRSCGPTSCVDGVVTGDICNGVGVCAGDATEDCAPYVCQGAACTSPCEGDGDCLDGFYCESGTCVEEFANGLGCSIANVCDSGFCVDGVCCNSPCQGQCQACAEDETRGTCATIEGTPRLPRAACGGTGLCQGSCDGGDPNACALPGSATTCGDDAACVGLDVSQPAESCDGSGACETPSTRNCAPYTCDAPTGECKTSCVSSAECAQGATCDALSGACAPTAATCADDFTVLTADGQLVSCAPYRCLVGSCQQQCVTDDDCAEDYTCEASSCVVDPTGSGGGGPGTGGAGATSGSGGSAATQASASTGATSSTGSTTAAGGEGGGAGDEDGGADGGCGCEAPGGQPRGGVLAVASLLVVGVAGARRRRGPRDGRGSDPGRAA